MKSEINISVELDENKLPNKIEWEITESDTVGKKTSNSMMISFWDDEEKETLGLDLWTPKMRVEEMDVFFFQTFMKMADTYNRATGNMEVPKMIEKFANEFAGFVNSSRQR